MTRTNRDARGVQWLEEMRRDLQYAVRSLSRNRGFAAIVIATLGLGIAANTAVFSVVNAVVLKPLNTPDGARLVQSVSTENGRSASIPSPYTFKVWRDLPAIFEDVSAYRLDSVSVMGGAEAEQLPVARVSAAFFRLFRAPLAAGRMFTADEDRPNGPAVAILSSSVWHRRFHGDPAAVGQTIMLGSTPYLVVGVLDAGFDSEQFEPVPEIWLPLQADPEHVDGASIYQVAARLRRGVTAANANAALAVAYVRWTTTVAIPSRPNRRGAWTAVPLKEAMVERARRSLDMLFAAVGALLIIACANVANLFLVRGDARRQEIAIRAAIGAGRGQLARQLVIESLVLASIGGAAGLVSGFAATRVLLRLYPGSNPFMLGALGTIPRIGVGGAAVSIDWRVFGFVLLLSVVTGVVFGLLPLRQFNRQQITRLLQSANAGGLHRPFGTGALFVTGQVALSVILVIGAALLVRTSLALRGVDPGFHPDHVVTMRMAISDTPFETRDGITELTRDGVQRVEAIPGVARASTTCCMPLETVWQLPFVIASRAGQGLTQRGAMRFHGFAGWTFVSPGYFDVLGVPILKGRDFSLGDDARAPGVVIINEAMARLYWPTSDPLREQLMIGRGMRPAYDQEPMRQIIGVVGNVRDTRLMDPPRPAMYVPVAQEPDGVTSANVKLLPLVWIVRTSTEPSLLIRPIRRALETAPGRLPVTRVREMREVVTDSTATSTFNTWLMVTFGVCALGLAAVGVYGLVAYWVQQRRHDIAVRLAMGAEGPRVARLVVEHGMRIALAGIALGTIAALMLGQAMTALVFGVTPRDPVVFVGTAVLLSIVALVATAIPARRASRMDPLQTLRAE